MPQRLQLTLHHIAQPGIAEEGEIDREPRGGSGFLALACGGSHDDAPGRRVTFSHACSISDWYLRRHFINDGFTAAPPGLITSRFRISIFK
jgi:hypothetical protein